MLRDLTEAESMNNSTNVTGLCVTGESSSEFDRISWVIAICLAILAAISNNLGVNLQKLAWTKKQRDVGKNQYRLIWAFGMLGIILASIFDFVALGFGPQSVIAPLGSLTMVMNGFVAPMMHGEKLRKKIIWTTLLIVAGCALAVATASHLNVTCTMDGIFAYFGSITFLVYAIVIFVIIVLTQLLIRRGEKILKKYGELSKEYEKIFQYHRVSYAFLAGLFGAQSVLFARSLGLLVNSSTRSGEVFLIRVETYAIIFALIVMIFLQMLNLNKGLEKFESTYNVPVFTGTFIVGTAVSGGIVYHEFADFTPLQSVLFPLGVCLCIVGVFALAWGNDEDTVDTGKVMNENLAFNTSEPPEIFSPSSRISIRSGGFTPFIIDNETITPSHHIRANRHTSLNHRDLLTGLKLDEIVHPPSSGDHSLFTQGSSLTTLGGSALKLDTRTPRNSNLNSTLDHSHPKTPSAHHVVNSLKTPGGSSSNKVTFDFDAPKLSPKGSLKKVHSASQVLESPKNSANV